MSDEFRPGEVPARAPHTGIVEHLCEHPGCRKWGGWGYSRPRTETRWFCYEHKADGEVLLGR